MYFSFALLVLALQVVELQACTPQNTNTVTEAPGPTKRKRRSLPVVEEVTITLVTNRKYDEHTKKSNHQRVRRVLDKFQKSEGFYIDYSEIQETIKQESGKFAIEYRISEECDQVKNFVRGAKAISNEIAYVLINCGLQPLQIL